MTIKDFSRHIKSSGGSSQLAVQLVRYVRYKIADFVGIITNNLKI